MTERGVHVWDQTESETRSTADQRNWWPPDETRRRGINPDSAAQITKTIRPLGAVRIALAVSITQSTGPR